MARIDYYNDPDARPANSVAPSTTAVVTDDKDRVLLVKRRDNDLWTLPGGGMDLGESIVETAVREVKEETGLDVEVTGLIGVYTNPRHVIAYTDGEVRQQLSLCFTTQLIGGQLHFDSESTDIAWTHPQDIESLNMHPSMRLASSTTSKTAPLPTWVSVNGLIPRRKLPAWRECAREQPRQAMSAPSTRSRGAPDPQPDTATGSR